MFIRVMLCHGKKTLTKNQQVFTLAQDQLHSPGIGLMVQTQSFLFILTDTIYNYTIRYNLLL